MTTSAPSPWRWIPSLVLGVALFALGTFIAVRPLFVHGRTFTGQRWLDMTFAAVFMFRGVLNVKTGNRRRAASGER